MSISAAAQQEQTVLFVCEHGAAKSVIAAAQFNKLAKEKGDHALAKKYARAGLEIDVLDTVCQEILLESLKAQNKDAELRALRKLLE